MGNCTTEVYTVRVPACSGKEDMPNLREMDKLGDTELYTVLRDLGRYARDWQHETASGLAERFGLSPAQARNLVKYIFQHPAATCEELQSVMRGYSR